MNPWWRERRTYFTKLSVEICRSRLTEATTRFLGRQVGRSVVSLTDFTLHRVTYYANGGKPYAYVSLAPGLAGGTIVKVSMSATLFGRIFLGFWFGFIAVWTAFATAASLRDPASAAWAPLFGMGMAAIGLVFNVATRLLAAGDPAFLLTFLEDLLHLEPPPSWALPVA